MRKFVFPIGLAIGLVLFVVTILNTASNPARAATTATCGLTTTQAFNHVVFTATWSGGNESGQYPFVFGDGAPSDVLTDTAGIKVLPHDYAYNVGEIVTYTAGFTVTGTSDSANCKTSVVIDDRQPAPSVDLVIVKQLLNHLTFGVAWTNGQPNQAHLLTFGDGSQTGFVGASGDTTTTHDYAYLVHGVINYTARITVTGSQGRTVTDSVGVVIDDRYKIYLPLIRR